MKNNLEKFYKVLHEKNHGQDAPFVRMAGIKNDNFELLDANLGVGSKTEAMMDFDLFRFLFRFGVQLMAEMIMGKEAVL